MKLSDQVFHDVGAVCPAAERVRHTGTKKHGRIETELCFVTTHQASISDLFNT